MSNQIHMLDDLGISERHRSLLIHGGFCMETPEIATKDGLISPGRVPKSFPTKSRVHSVASHVKCHFILAALGN